MAAALRQAQTVASPGSTLNPTDTAASQSYRPLTEPPLGVTASLSTLEELSGRQGLPESTGAATLFRLFLFYGHCERRGRSL
ncbi:hypothetical protein KUCAC02_006398 [Chaenocephalus aceratus]|uniref:Uncharacterized protein n=1 Tax=Chaenocephalus aceratus TaxID=36190 RepID=A0ACB9VSL8_CHAAC|nr:hypothetical protein KUCAC02_006398 [Chaenocephalus aceratus]